MSNEDDFDMGDWFCAAMDASQSKLPNPNFKITGSTTVVGDGPTRHIFHVLNRNTGAVHEVSIVELRRPV